MGKGYGEMSINNIDPAKQEIDAKANKRVLLSLLLGIIGIVYEVTIHISAMFIAVDDIETGTVFAFTASILGFVLAVPAVILGLKSVKNRMGRGKAIGGIVTGAIGIFIGLAIIFEYATFLLIPYII